MKQKDILLIGAVVFASGVISFIISGRLITTPSNRSQQVDVVPIINATFNQPDSQYFNQNSIDPTKLIQIGNNSNQTPFNTQTSQ
jgi:hypothetical protein